MTAWFSSLTAEKGSLESRIRDKGLYWVTVDREIKRNAFVQDLLEGRLNQPEGRGAIGRVKSLGFAENGEPYAIVDFGRGYKIGIFLAELSSINFTSRPPQVD